MGQLSGKRTHIDTITINISSHTLIKLDKNYFFLYFFAFFFQITFFRNLPKFLFVLLVNSLALFILVRIILICFSNESIMVFAK